MPFSHPQRSLLVEALNDAEERTMEYYRIPPFRWEQLRYDLLTQKDTEWEPLPDPALARVRPVQQAHRDRLFDFYRIELNDPGILAAARRERLTDRLYPFFVYILTHEIVHMVRLSSILGEDADSLPPCDEAEERRVEDISRRILTGSDFEPVLRRFCTGAIPL
ncbi:MAG: hypothetical protein GXY47_03225 [Acidobacteria bacterium]|nr:hypothetical protein [Acidobacteriota bacterium]